MTIYAVSLDDVVSLARFAKEEKLGFRLLSDPDGSAAKKFGVLRRGGRFARRVTFVLDEKGVLRHVNRKIDVRIHGVQVVELIRKLRT